MTRVQERQAELATIRRRPIAPALKAILEAAAEATGIDSVIVVSGGQGRAGSGLPRTGSTRHDDGNAADVELKQGGRTLNFDAGDRGLVAAFITACAARGATGIGGSADYMGPTRLHIGFGSRAVWGGRHKNAAGAPRWLREAVAEGWEAPQASPAAARPVLRSGDSGEAVKALQAALARAGYGVTVDGAFGPKTERAVVAFQTAKGLFADGVVGTKTWAALEG